MTDRFNTIAGWTLFAGIIALGSSVVVGEVYKAERPEHMGYPIPGVVSSEGGAEAEKPIAFYLATADLAKGEQAFKKCAACHNADKGGANALGPALYGIMGNAVAAVPGFAYSDALKSKGGTWDWQTMSDWLSNPRKFAPGTKMTFAGLGDPQERASLIAFLNSRDDSPLPVPAAPAEAAAGSDAEAKPGSGTNDGPQKAENEPVRNEAQAAQNPGIVGGEGSAKKVPSDKAQQ